MPRPRFKTRNDILSERVNLALTPGDYEGLVALASLMKMSINAVVSSLIHDLIIKNKPTLDAYIAAREQAAESITLDFGNPLTVADRNQQE